MKPHTRILHLRLIRLLKGCLTAWEEWLRAQPKLENSSTTDSEAIGG